MHSSRADEDARWLDAAARLAERGRPTSNPNPAVGAIVVSDGRVVGRGWTRRGGRPHAEAMALAEAGPAAQRSTVYVTLEPCAHESARGPACAGLLANAAPARVIVGAMDPDPRTAGGGIALLERADIAVTRFTRDGVADSLAGYLSQRSRGRPFVTLKLAMSIDGGIALANGESQWITGDAARAHSHLERARHDAILVGGGTLRADAPRLDVRLPGLAARSPRRIVLTRKPVPAGWQAIGAPEAIASLTDVQYLMIEGGAQTAAAFLATDLVDRLLVYRAPIVIGRGLGSVADIGLARLADAHGRWRLSDRRTLGSDTMEVYRRTVCSPVSSPPSAP